MRTNTSKVLAAFEAGKALKQCSAVWTDGESVFSYGTCIVTPVPGGLAFNATKYSVTTSGHQRALYTALLPRVIVHLQDQRQGVTSYGLRDAARDVLALADAVNRDYRNAAAM
jgi:hypothetical protein